MPPASGPAIARLFLRLLAVVYGIAWWSLGQQVETLLGSRGLLPVQPLAAALRRDADVSFWDFPAIAWWLASDAALVAGVWLGGLLAALALLGIWPRLLLGLSALWYLGYATTGRTFLAFQWDNLLIECGFLAMFLPRHRPAWWVHLLFRVLLFKLYFESGVAKWQSHLGDWHDGSAMLYYYETAPLPTWVGWYLHHLPAAWHALESWLTLGLELLLPFAIFAPRRGRRVALVGLTGFQVLNLLTGNYGFFVYLALALHVFLLTDADLPAVFVRLRRWLRGRWPALARRLLPRPWAPGHSAGRLLAGVWGVVYLYVSAVDAGVMLGSRVRAERPLGGVLQTWRLVNTYHLFGHITRERIEPEVQIHDGTTWQAQWLRYKPGPVQRPPGFVAPHQPRVDFQLWFHGLQARQQPPYVTRLLQQVCDDPAAVQSLFAAPLPGRRDASRMVYWRYHFTTPGERAATGAWWSRTWVGAHAPRPCGAAAP